MDYETIKTQLKSKGYSMSMIADALGCTPVNIHQVCRGDTTSLRVASAVATVLELPIEEVFPEVPSYINVQHLSTSRKERVEALQQRLAS